jgi:hypothetical protein
MATLIAKAGIAPTIERVRTTCAGTQYMVATPQYLDVVTVNGGHITCTCDQFACPHIQVVQTRRAQAAVFNSRREVYVVFFGIYNC